MKSITIKARLIFVIGLLVALLVGIGIMGLKGKSESNDGLQRVYEDRLVPTGQIAQIDRLMAENVIQLQLAAMHDPRMEESRLHDHPITLHTDQIRENIQEITDIWSAYMKTKLTREEAQLAEEFERLRGAFVREGILPAVELYEDGRYEEANIHMVRTTVPGFRSANGVADALKELQLEVAEREYAVQLADYVSSRTITIAAIALGALVALILGFLLVRAIVVPLDRTIRYFSRIAEGHLDNEIKITANDEVGKVLHALADMQAKLKADITETRRVGNENQRIRNALDSVTANVMVADANHDIIYINEAVHQMFRRGAKDIRRDLPNFDPERLLGSNIDLFHKDPAHQRQMLEALRGNHSSEIMVGGRTYALVASAIFNDEGERLGTAVQWTDRTEEVAVEKEINTLVSGAVNGDLGQRIDLEGKEGFFHKLGKGINQLMDVTQTGLNEVSRVLGEVARGNLNERVTGDYRGTFGQLQQDTNDTVDKLKSLIGQIKESVDTINTAAKEISSGNTDLSQRTEEQASSLEQTASSMEELTSTVKQNAENARQANQLASSASEVAAEGGSKVRQAVSKMHELTESSEKISGIISVIDGIAFQTNILALNAAVEAARAGEQGRGFAVVAGEVRNLAQRSAAAAKEIQALITADGEIVAHGSKLVEEAGGIMGDIVNEVRRVTDLMAEISAASDEQSQGIEQVNQAVTQMDEVTQQNAALVEEAAAAAESLEEQSEGLARAVSFFKVDDSVVTHEAPRLGGARRPAVAPASARKAKTARPAGGARHGGKPARAPDKASSAGRASSHGQSGHDADDWEEF
ncbi:MAG: methyl-accepting chemotaxis protein [Halothiobacillaceae bacterium]